MKEILDKYKSSQISLEEVLSSFYFYEIDNINNKLNWHKCLLNDGIRKEDYKGEGKTIKDAVINTLKQMI